MKVILLKDVAKIGKKFEVKDVADGYALNSLLPKGDAKFASKEALKEVEAIKAQADADKKIQEDLLAKNLHEIDGKTLQVTLKANKQGHLFAGLHNVEISALIKEHLHADVSPDFIELPKPIKETGEHEIHIKAHDKKATLKLTIEG